MRNPIRSVLGHLSCAALFVLGAINVVHAQGHADQRVLAAAKECESKERSLIERLVRIDSGTGDVPGLTAVGTLLRAELEAIGARVENIAAVAPAQGDNLVATLTGTGKGRILLIAHIDTVFPHGTVAQHPYAIVGDHGVGPGSGDDKSGVATAVCALSILQQLHWTDYAQIKLLLNSNEETGSGGSRDLIRSLAKQSDAAINLERGVPPDGVLVSRKGSAILTIEITGRAAHSGLEPEKGRNAAIEAAHQALQLGQLANAEKQTTVNVTVLEGGEAINVIPAHATVKADVRAYSKEEFDRVEEGLHRLSRETIVPGVEVTATLIRNFPPWPHSASTDALVERARKLYSEIYGSLATVSVGSSADVAFAAETGVPSIDGLGILGGGAHSLDDYADLASIVPRLYLLTRMVMDIGEHPPAN
jgi:glutamate carboxypeptidase